MYMVSMQKAYSYTRFSTPEQAQGDSARRQTEAARKWAEERGLELDNSLRIDDLGVSAYRGKNIADGGLGRFIEAVHSGLVEPGSWLIVESLDRLSRMEPLLAQHQLSSLILADVNVITLSDGQEYTRERLQREPVQWIVSFLVAMRAHEESATKGKRVAAAWGEKRRKVRNGEVTRLTLRAPAWLRADGAGWGVDEAKAAIVRRVYALTLDGYGEHRIAEQFNREGVPVLGKGKRWHRSSVAKLLRNRAVLGELVPGRIEHVDGVKRRALEEPIKDHFPAIIAEAQWSAVRAIKDGQTSAARGRGAQAPLANVFSGLARCPICGDAMTRVTKGNSAKAGVPKLVCTRAKAGAGCSYRPVPIEQAQGALFRHWARLMEDIPAGDGAGELDAKAADLAAHIRGQEEHLRDLLEELDSRGPSPSLTQCIYKLEAELGTLRVMAVALEDRRRLIDGGLMRERAYALAEDIKAHCAEGGPLEPINARLKSLFSGVVVDYLKGDLVFRWKQGGETRVPYAYDWPDASQEAGAYLDEVA